MSREPNIDPTHVPGASPLYGAWDLEVPSWQDEASRLADQYCAAFDPAARRASGPEGLEGWLSAPATLFVAVHPLWKIGLHTTDPLNHRVLSWAASLGASHVILLDTFNLGRRMAWVRGNLRVFPVLPVDGGPVTPAGPAATDGWMEQLAAMEVGGTLEHDGKRWVRCETQDAWTASPGVWLARRREEPLFEATVRNIPGAGLRIRAKGSDQGFLSRDQWSALRLVARRDEQDTGG